MAVPLCQIVCMEMVEMTMDDFVDDEVANMFSVQMVEMTMDNFVDDEVANMFSVHWSRVDRNVLLVDVQS